MKGWIIYDRKAYKVEGNTYENTRFLEVAKEMNIELEILRPDQFDLIVTREDKKSILINDQPTSLPDFIIPRMGAGTSYFALAVIRHIERLGIFSVNSAESIEIVKDKLYSQQILAQNDLPVPKTMLLKFPVDVELVGKHLGFPVIVKMLSGSQGSGVFLAQTRTQFLDLMHIIENANKNANIILQEFIQTSHGKDLRVFTVGGRVIGCMKRSSSTGDFKANFSAGGTVEEFPLNSEIEWLATQTSQILNLDVAGIDLLFAGDHYKICEANSAPGFKGFESCIKVNAAKEIFSFVKLRTEYDGLAAAHIIRINLDVEILIYLTEKSSVSQFINMKNSVTVYFHRIRNVQRDAFYGVNDELVSKLKKSSEKYRQLADRNRFVSGRLLIRHALTQHGFENVSLSDMLYSDYLKPYFDLPFYFNLSHSGEYVILAVSLISNVGCDIEFHNPDLNFSEFNSFFTDDELSSILTSPLPVKSFFDLWTIKESLLKADGRGMHFPPKSLRLHNDYGFVGNKKIFFRCAELAEQYSTAIACTENFDSVQFVEVVDIIQVLPIVR